MAHVMSSDGTQAMVYHVNHPRQEPCAVIPLAGICAGAAG